MKKLLLGLLLLISTFSYSQEFEERYARLGGTNVDVAANDGETFSIRVSFENGETLQVDYTIDTAAPQNDNEVDDIARGLMSINRDIHIVASGGLITTPVIGVIYFGVWNGEVTAISDIEWIDPNLNDLRWVEYDSCINISFSGNPADLDDRDSYSVTIGSVTGASSGFSQRVSVDAGTGLNTFEAILNRFVEELVSQGWDATTDGINLMINNIPEGHVAVVGFDGIHDLGDPVLQVATSTCPLPVMFSCEDLEMATGGVELTQADIDRIAGDLPVHTHPTNAITRHIGKMFWENIEGYPNTVVVLDYPFPGHNYSTFHIYYKEGGSHNPISFSTVGGAARGHLCLFLRTNGQ